MAKEQRDDDWQDDSAMVEIIFSARGVALYGTTLADNVPFPTPMLCEHCHKICDDDEGKWHLLDDIPVKQMHDGERIVTMQWYDLTSEEREKLPKKVSESQPSSESPSKRPRIAESLKKFEDVEGEQEWKHQKNGPLQDPEKKTFVLYKVVEKEWMKPRTRLLQKISQDDDVQNNPEHYRFKERHKALLEKHGPDLQSFAQS